MFTWRIIRSAVALLAGLTSMVWDLIVDLFKLLIQVIPGVRRPPPWAGPR